MHSDESQQKLTVHKLRKLHHGADILIFEVGRHLLEGVPGCRNTKMATAQWTLEFEMPSWDGNHSREARNLPPQP